MYRILVLFIDKLKVIEIKFSNIQDLLDFLNTNQEQIKIFTLFYFKQCLLTWKSFYLTFPKKIQLSDLIEIKRGNYKNDSN